MIQFLVLGIAAMLCLAGGVIFFVVLYQRRIIHHQLEIKRINEQKQQELLKASLESEERERNRIAAELHDDVGATLSSVRLYLSTAERLPQNRDALGHSKQLLDESIQKVRDISHKLQPSTLETFGLDIALASLANVIDRAGVIRMSYQAIPPLPVMNTVKQLTLYRIVQELINNIIKHSAADYVSLKAWGEGNQWMLGLEHDGTGITQNEFLIYVDGPGSGGMKNIANRLNSINGSICFEQTSEGKFTIFIKANLENL